MLELQRLYLQPTVYIYIWWCMQNIEVNSFWGFNSMALPQKEYNREDLIYGVKGLFTRLKWRLITFVIKSSQKWRLCYSENERRPLIVIRRSSSNEKSWTVSWVSRRRLHIHGLRSVICRRLHSLLKNHKQFSATTIHRHFS